MSAKKKPVQAILSFRVPYAVARAIRDWAAKREGRKVGSYVRDVLRASKPDLPWDVETMAEDLPIEPRKPVSDKRPADV